MLQEPHTEQSTAAFDKLPINVGLNTYRILKTSIKNIVCAWPSGIYSICTEYMRSVLTPLLVSTIDNKACTNVTESPYWL